jgi:hypothetical protein
MTSKSNTTRATSRNQAPMLVLEQALVDHYAPILAKLDESPNPRPVDESTNQGHTDKGLMIRFDAMLTQLQRATYGLPDNTASQTYSSKAWFDEAAKRLNDLQDKYGQDEDGYLSDPESARREFYASVNEMRFDADRELLVAYKKVYRTLFGVDWKYEPRQVKAPASYLNTEALDARRQAFRARNAK